MKIFDKNKDGCLDLNDLARYFWSYLLQTWSSTHLAHQIFLCFSIRILALEENFLLQFQIDVSVSFILFVWWKHGARSWCISLKIHLIYISLKACSKEERKKDFDKIFAHYDVVSTRHKTHDYCYFLITRMPCPENCDTDGVLVWLTTAEVWSFHLLHVLQSLFCFFGNMWIKISLTVNFLFESAYGHSAVSLSDTDMWLKNLFISCFFFFKCSFHLFFQPYQLHQLPIPYRYHHHLTFSCLN